jgi:hypothetical protein
MKPQRALQSPENPNATLDTLASPADDARYPDCGRRHGHCGLAAEPGPREVRGGLPRQRH